MYSSLPANTPGNHDWTPKLMTLGEHEDWITALAVTNDDRYLITASQDCTLKVWDLQLRMEKAFLVGHEDEVTAMVVTPDGKTVFSASADQTLKAWNLSIGDELKTLEGHSRRVNSLALVRGGRLLVSGSSDATLRVWDLTTGQTIRVLKGHQDAVNAVAVSMDGTIAASGSDDGLVLVWELGTGKILAALKGHPGEVRTVHISPSGKRLISTDEEWLRAWSLPDGTWEYKRSGKWLVPMTADGSKAICSIEEETAENPAGLVIWNLADGQEITTLGGHDSELMVASLSADGRLLASADASGFLLIRDLINNTEINQEDVGQLTCGTFTRAGNSYLFGDNDGKVSMLQLKSEAVPEEEGPFSLPAQPVTEAIQVFPVNAHTENVNAVEISPNGELAVSISPDKSMVFWDAAGRKVRRVLNDLDGIPYHLAIPQDGKSVVAALSDGSIGVWDWEKGSQKLALRAHKGEANWVVMSPDGMRIYSASDDTDILAWEYPQGRALFRMGASRLPVQRLVVTPDGRYLVSAAGIFPNTHEDFYRASSTISLWNLEMHGHICDLGKVKWVDGLEVTPDGRHVVAASSTPDDCSIDVWDIGDNKHAQHFEGRGPMTISRDNRWIVCCNNHHEVQVWDINEQTMLWKKKIHAEFVHDIKLSPDGRYASSVGSDRKVILWSIENGEILASYTGRNSMMRVDISLDGKTIIAGDETGTIYFLLPAGIPCGPVIVTPWQAPGGGIKLFSSASRQPGIHCPRCNTWSEVPPGVPAENFPCPHCSLPLRLAGFTIPADWRKLANPRQ